MFVNAIEYYTYLYKNYTCNDNQTNIDCGREYD